MRSIVLAVARSRRGTICRPFGCRDVRHYVACRSPSARRSPSPALAAGDPVVLGGDAGLDAGAPLGARLRGARRRRAAGRRRAGADHRASAMAASPEAADDFVDQLVDGRRRRAGRRARARRTRSVPEPALRRARAAGLPLVVLNRRCASSRSPSRCTGRSWPSSSSEVRFAGEVHQTFTELGLARAPMARLVEAAADLAGCSVVLEDLSRRVLVAAARGRAGRPAADRLGATVAADAVPPGRPGSGGPEGWLTTPVGIQGGAWGRLVADRPARRGAGPAGARARRAGARARPDDRARRDRRSSCACTAGSCSTCSTAGSAREAVAAARLRALGVPEAASYVGAVARLRSEASGGPAGVRARRACRGWSACSTRSTSGCWSRRTPTSTRWRARWPRSSPTRCWPPGHPVDRRARRRRRSLRSARVVADVAVDAAGVRTAACGRPTSGCPGC